MIHPKRQPPPYVFLIDHLRCCKWIIKHILYGPYNMVHKSMRPEWWPDFKMEKTMKMDLPMLRRPFASAIGVWFRQRETDTINNILFFTPFQSYELWSQTENLRILYVPPWFSLWEAKRQMNDTKWPATLITASVSRLLVTSNHNVAIIIASMTYSMLLSHAVTKT